MRLAFRASPWSRLLLAEENHIVENVAHTADDTDQTYDLAELGVS